MADPLDTPDDTLPVLNDMSDLTDAALAQEQASVPPEAPQIETPEIEAPPQQDMLQELGEVTKAEAGLFHEQKPPKQTAWQKRHQGSPPEQPENHFPFKVAPPLPTADVMREMGETTKVDAGFDGKGKRVADMPPSDLERIATAGEEQIAISEHRFVEVLENFNRLFTLYGSLLSNIAQMTTTHEKRLHEIEGLIERGRS